MASPSWSRPPRRIRADFTEQPLDAQQAFVTLKRETERLFAQIFVVGVQERDDRARFAQSAPGALKYGVLAPQLIPRRQRRRGLAAETLGPGNGLATGLRLVRLVAAHVGNPVTRSRAPLSVREVRICTE